MFLVPCDRVDLLISSYEKRKHIGNTYQPNFILYLLGFRLFLHGWRLSGMKSAAAIMLVVDKVGVTSTANIELRVSTECKTYPDELCIKKGYISRE